MSQQSNLSENDLFKMSASNEKNKKPGSSGNDIDSLRDFMRASSGKTPEKKESKETASDSSYQPAIYKKPAREENSETPPPLDPKPNPVIDYRKNVQRQVKEQKKVGSALSFLMYGVLAVVLVFGALASYGAYVIFGELRAQKATAQQIQNELTGQISALQADLSQTQAALEQQSQQANETLVGLQGKLQTQEAAFQNSLATEKRNREAALKARDNQIYELRQRLRQLENRY